MLPSQWHPPLSYLGERIIFQLFGYSEQTARLLPATAGVAGIWAMYLFGRELAGRKAGLFAALLTSINFFHIYYSREARSYSLLFLFAALTFVYFFWLIKQLKTSNHLAWSCFALLTAYTHYFGILLVCAQFASAGILLLWTAEKPIYIGMFAGSAIVLALCYTPWLSSLAQANDIKSFWIDTGMLL